MIYKWPSFGGLWFTSDPVLVISDLDILAYDLHRFGELWFSSDLVWVAYELQVTQFWL